MKIIKFYGCSDDLFECEVENGRDDEQTDIAAGKLMTFHISSSDGQMLVSAKYLKNGCWMIGVAPIDEDVPIPDWPLHISNYWRDEKTMRTYSAQIIVHAPDDVTVKRWKHAP